MTTVESVIPLPRLAHSEVVVPPPSTGPGSWAGAPCALVDDGRIYLAYRLRRPVGEGRGYANVVAVSVDGRHFTPLVTLDRDRFAAESLERPALVRTRSGRWRLYLSLATPGTKHWRVALLEADSIAGLASAPARTVLPGDEQTAVKDPVIHLDAAGRWHVWASLHPLQTWEGADRMATHYATSPDGVAWTWHGPVLTGDPDGWDARGVRVSSVTVTGENLIATYDGRATAAENWEEATGVATGRLGPGGRFGRLQRCDLPPLRSPYAGGGLRYVSPVATEEGIRVYYEFTRPDGAHELRTELLPG